MKTIDEIIKEWQKDSVVDITDPSKEIIRIPTLHSKYLGFSHKHRLVAKKTATDIAKMKKKKWEYYTGKMSREQLEIEGWEPFQFTLKSDVSIYLDADDDLITLTNKKSYHEEATLVCESILKELNQRTWQLREHMQHERFINGAR